MRFLKVPISKVDESCLKLISPLACQVNITLIMSIDRRCHHFKYIGRVRVNDDTSSGPLLALANEVGPILDPGASALAKEDKAPIAVAGDDTRKTKDGR